MEVEETRPPVDIHNEYLVRSQETSATMLPNSGDALIDQLRCVNEKDLCDIKLMTTDAQADNVPARTWSILVIAAA